jgi:phage terminase large subunit-like protein
MIDYRRYAAALEEIARQRPAAVRKHVCEHPKYLASFLALEVRDFHLDILEDAIRFRETLTLAPRGAGKSLMTIVVAAFLLVAWPGDWGEEMPSPEEFWAGADVNPSNLRVLIVGASTRNAVNMLSHLATMLRASQMERIFGCLQGERWTANFLDTSFRKSIAQREPSATAQGMQGRIRSIHADLLIADDLVGVDTASKKSQRKNLVHRWNTEVVFVRESHARTIYCGTRYHVEDFWGRLCDQYADGKFPNVCRIQALQGDPQQSYWEEHAPLEYLMELRDEVGHLAFELQMQQTAENITGGLYQAEWLEDELRFEDLTEAQKARAVTVIGLDPSTTSSADSDPSCFVVLTVVKPRDATDRPLFLVREVVHARQMSVLQMVQVGARLYKKYSAVRLGIEVVGGFELVAQRFREEAPWLKLALIRPGGRGAKSKEDIARSFTPFFELGLVRFEPATARNGIDYLRQELMAFGNGSGHDDSVDAFHVALRALGGGARTRGVGSGVKLHKLGIWGR